jgi:cation diffusion facilitator family transporter
MRAAIVHVLADAVVSVLVVTGLVLARTFGWLWMDPVAGLCGTLVIASWSYGLVRDTGAILLDMVPDRALAADIRTALELDGDRLHDLHLWRLGPGHLGATIVIATWRERDNRYYRDRLSGFSELSHLTIEIDRPKL